MKIKITFVLEYLLYRSCLPYYEHRRNLLVTLMKDVENIENIDYQYLIISGTRALELILIYIMS